MPRQLFQLPTSPDPIRLGAATMKRNPVIQRDVMRMRAEGFIFTLAELYQLFRLAVGKSVPGLKAYIYEAAADQE